MSELLRLEAADIGGIGFVICFLVEVDVVEVDIVVVVVDSFVVTGVVYSEAVVIVVVEAEFTVVVEAEVLDMVVEVLEVVVVDCDVDEEALNFSARFSAACLSLGKKVKNENGVSLTTGLSAVTSGNKVVVLRVVSIGMKVGSVVVLVVVLGLVELRFMVVAISV